MADLNTDLDNTSRLLLVRLHEVGGEATAGELKEPLGLSQNQQIHYRMDERLIPANLVENAGREPQPGARKDARIYRLTNDGKQWVRDHGHKVTVSSLDDAEALLRELLDEVSDLRKLAKNAENAGQKAEGNYHAVHARLNEVEDEMEAVEVAKKRAEAAMNRTSNLRSNFNAEKEIKAVRDDVDSLRDRLSEVEEREVVTPDQLAQLRQDVNALSTRLDDFSAWSHQIDQRVTNLEQKASQSLLRRLIPF